MSDTSELVPVHVRIQQFQSIEDIEFDICGFTCITGPTNIGKSAIMRAMSRSINNDPVTGMVRKGSKFCTVEQSSGKWGFKWEKGERDVNRYTIDDKVYDKIGQNQLPEVAAMGFGSVKIGPDEIQPWWANQYEPIFLLNRSGPQVTDFISEVSNLRQLQNAIILAARGKKQHFDVSKERVEELQRVQARLEKIALLAEVELLAGELELQRESIAECEKKLALCDQFRTQLQSLEKRIAAISPIETASVPDDDKVGAAVTRLEEMYRHWCALQSAAKSIIAVRGVKEVTIPDGPDDDVRQLQTAKPFANISHLQASVDTIIRVSSVQIPDGGKLDEAVTNLRSMQRMQHMIVRATDDVADLLSVENANVPSELDMPDIKAMQRHSVGITEAKNDISQSQKKYEQTSELLKSIEDELSQIAVCPTCERPVGEQHTGQHKKVVVTA